MFRRAENFRAHCIEMAENQIIKLNGKPVEVTCLDGLIWITDGVGGEGVCQRGRRLTFGSKGTICVQAFMPSSVRIRPLVPEGNTGWQHAGKGVRAALLRLEKPARSVFT